VVVVVVVVALVGRRCAVVAANVTGSVGGRVGRQPAASRQPTLRGTRQTHRVESLLNSKISQTV